MLSRTDPEALKENYHKSHKLYIVKVSLRGFITTKVELAALYNWLLHNWLPSKTGDSSLNHALFWRDYNLRTINPDDVVGIGGRASNLGSVASWCGIELTHPKMRVIGGARWNQTFENPLIPLNVKPMGGTSRFIEGWELTS